MTSPVSSMARRLADAARTQAVQAGASEATVRGSDWRTATVSTVNADGTITTTDGIPARRLETYELPAVGDLIVLTQSSGGSWLAAGRMAPTTGDAWQTPVFAAPWQNYVGNGNYQLPRYRRVGNEVIIEGLASTGTTSVTGTSTIFTLPVGYRPATSFVFPAMTAGSAVRQLDVFDTGIVRIANVPAGAINYLSLNCRFSLF